MNIRAKSTLITAWWQDSWWHLNKLFQILKEEEVTPGRRGRVDVDKTATEEEKLLDKTQAINVCTKAGTSQVFTLTLLFTLTTHSWLKLEPVLLQHSENSRTVKDLLKGTNSEIEIQSLRVALKGRGFRTKRVCCSVTWVSSSSKEEPRRFETGGAVTRSVWGC